MSPCPSASTPRVARVLLTLLAVAACGHERTPTAPHEAGPRPQAVVSTTVVPAPTGGAGRVVLFDDALVEWVAVDSATRTLRSGGGAAAPLTREATDSLLLRFRAIASSDALLREVAARLAPAPRTPSCGTQRICDPNRDDAPPPEDGIAAIVDDPGLADDPAIRRLLAPPPPGTAVWVPVVNSASLPTSSSCLALANEIARQQTPVRTARAVARSAIADGAASLTNMAKDLATGLQPGKTVAFDWAAIRMLVPMLELKLAFFENARARLGVLAMMYRGADCANREWGAVPAAGGPTSTGFNVPGYPAGWVPAHTYPPVQYGYGFGGSGGDQPAPPARIKMCYTMTRYYSDMTTVVTYLGCW